MVNEWLEPELHQTILDLRAKLESATVDIRNVPGLTVPLSVPELFATRRAAGLPVKVRQMWKALNDLDEQEIKAPGGYPYAALPDVLVPLSDKCYEAVKKHGRLSPEHNAERQAFSDACYGEGLNAQSYEQLKLQQRRDAANVGY